MLPIELSVEDCRALASDAEAGVELVVDLEKQEITRGEHPPIQFTTDPFRRTCLLNGFDDIATTMQDLPAIAAFEQRRSQMWPWLDGIGYAGKKVKVKSSGTSAMEW
jgi:3-isopropylmalate dehydratase